MRNNVLHWWDEEDKIARLEDSVMMNFKTDGLGFRRYKEVVGQSVAYFVYDLARNDISGLTPLVAEGVVPFIWLPDLAPLPSSLKHSLALWWNQFFRSYAVGLATAQLPAMTARSTPISMLPEGRQQGSPTNPSPSQEKKWGILFDPLGFMGERRAKLFGGNPSFAQPPNLT